VKPGGIHTRPAGYRMKAWAMTGASLRHRNRTPLTSGVGRIVFDSDSDFDLDKKRDKPRLPGIRQLMRDTTPGFAEIPECRVKSLRLLLVGFM